MLRCATFVAGLLLAAVASADVQIFFTAASAGAPWAGAGPANVWAPTAGRGLDYTADGNVPDYGNFPDAFSANTVISAHDFAYVWVQFTAEHGVPVQGAKLQVLHLKLSGGPEPLDVVYYLQNDGPGRNLRWDGQATPPNFPEFKRNPQLLLAVTATGILNVNRDVPPNLYHGAARTALLGAVKAAPGVYQYELGSQGMGILPGGPFVPMQFGILTVPEPAALGIFALAGVLLRYRRAAIT
ncbi:MAG: hypothetical protein AB1716_14385 [Planctomycetota bacterium]